LARREEAGPQALARGGYQNLIKYPIRVTTQVYELEGTLEWAGRFDFSTVIMEGTRDFVPLYDTTLTAILIPGLRIESPAVLFNRKPCSLTGRNHKNCLKIQHEGHTCACGTVQAKVTKVWWLIFPPRRKSRIA
ncbi:MAG: hypothetical protein Q8N45_00150, partial [Anaerolineales bacterium]|nr:hypothetical protein [Anaerolineales bacterium]